MLVDMIGDRLKELRTAAGMNQPEFGAIVGTTKQYVSQLESGKNRMPNGEYLEGWARYFRVSPRWLVSGTGPKHEGSLSDEGSQPMRLDTEIVEATHKALTDMYSLKGRTYHEEDVARFVLVYEKLALRKAGVSEAELFGAGLSDTLTPQGATSERTAGVPSKGTDKGVVARRIRRKA
ncbi:MAG: helix-turn-helix transcriptional regulator [Rhodanobacter sp.]